MSYFFIALFVLAMSRRLVAMAVYARKAEDAFIGTLLQRLWCIIWHTAL